MTKLWKHLSQEDLDAMYWHKREASRREHDIIKPSKRKPSHAQNSDDSESRRHSRPSNPNRNRSSGAYKRGMEMVRKETTTTAKLQRPDNRQSHKSWRNPSRPQA
jgi:hypothetical protein